MNASDSLRSVRRSRTSRVAVSLLFGIGLLLLLLSAVLLSPALSVRAHEAEPNFASGPDEFGYILKDSNEVDGPVYQWEEISVTGTLVSDWSGYNYGFSGPIPIGFSFDYYGETYDSLFVGTNGYVSFGTSYGTIPSGSPPNPSLPNNDIALFGGNMYLYDYGNDSEVYYQTLTNPNRFILEIRNLYYCCWQNTAHTFELILYPRGDILVQYQELNDDDSDYVGIENAQGTDGLNYTVSLADELAIKYTYPEGVTIRPSTMTKIGEPGTVITYEVGLVNHTNASDSFTLTVQSDDTWEATLSLTQTGAISDGDQVDFLVTVDILPEALPGESQTVTVTATSLAGPGTYTDMATYRTFASSDGLAYVAVSNHNYLALVEINAGLIVGTVDLQASGCGFPWRVAIPPDGETVWVSCRYSASIIILDRSNNEVMDVITDISAPSGIAFTRNGAHALIGKRSSDDVSVVDTTTYSVTTVSVESQPVSVVTHPYRPVAYVIHRLFEGIVSVIDTDHWAVIDSIDVGRDPHFATISRDGLKLYVSNLNDSSVSVVDTTTNSEIAIVNIGSMVRDLDISPDGKTLYVTTNNNQIVLVNTVSNTIQQTISFDAAASFITPWAAKLNCDGSKLAVSSAHSNFNDISRQIAVIDTATLSTTLISLPDTDNDGNNDTGARGLAICPRYVSIDLFMIPSVQENSGAKGTEVSHSLTFHNFSGISDTYDLSLGGHIWPTSLTTDTIGPIAHEESASFSVTTTVPLDTDWYLTDTVVVTVTSINSPTVFSTTAQVTTQAYAPPQISVVPDQFTSSQLVDEVVTKELTINNGNGVDLSFEIESGVAESNTLEELLESLNANYESVINLIPNRYEFSEGESGFSIGDGGNDMYDGGNYLATDLGGSLEYSNDIIVENTFFGASGRYFTRKFPGLFVLIADMEGVDNFVISGNLGADGSGSVDGSVLEITGFGGTYRGFVKRVYNAGDPSVNHLIIVHDNPSADHTFSSDTNNDFHEVVGLTSNSRIYYLLYAGEGGFYINDDAARNIMETFLRALDLTPPAPWLSTNPISGTIPTSSSEVVDVIFDANGVQPGDHDGSLYIFSNDPLSKSKAIPVMMHVDTTADMGWVTGFASDAWSGATLEASVDLVGVHALVADADYTIWATAGSYTLEASADGYASKAYDIAITAGNETIQDIALEPYQPRIEFEPDRIEVIVLQGLSTDTDLTVANTGPAALEVSFHERPVSQETLTSLQANLEHRKILFDRAHNEPASSNYSTLIADLTTAGAQVDENFIFPIDAAALEGYDVLWVNCCGGTNWTFPELTVLSEWLDGGGAILVHGNNSNATSGPAGIYGITYGNGCTYGTTTDIEDHAITIEVSNVSVDTCNFLTLGSGSSVAVWDTADQPHVVVHEEDRGKMVVVAGDDITNWRIDQADNRILANNIMSWLAQPGYEDVSWLSTDPVETIIGGHEEKDITVHIDATNLSINTYQAILAIEHNDPNQTSPVEILVSLSVIIVDRYLLLLPTITNN